MTELPSKTVDEIKTCTHNFAPDIGDPAVTIDSVTFTKSMVKSDPVSDSGFGPAIPAAVPDTGAALLTIGVHQIIAQKVLVLYGAGLEGNEYECRAHATCSDGQVLVNAVRFSVRNSAA